MKASNDTFYIKIYYHKIRDCRLINLKSNLIKEILAFLPIDQLLNSIIATSKKIKSSVNNISHISYIKHNFNNILNHITFLEEDLESFKNKITPHLAINCSIDSRAILNQIYLFMIVKKYYKNTILNLSPNCRQDSDPKDFSLLSRFISKEKICIKELNLYDNDIGNNQENFNLLAEGISKNKTIETLILGKII